MRNVKLLALILFLLPIVVYGQKSSKKNRQINVSAYINYNLQSYNIAWEESSTRLAGAFELEFLTSSSGMFEIEYDSLSTNQITTLQFPQNRLNIGFGYQTLNDKNVYHEFQIPIFNLSRSSEIIERRVDDAVSGIEIGKWEWLTNIRLFQLGLRYEIGKYLGEAEKGKLKLGFGINIGTIYSHYKNDYQDFYFNTPISPNLIKGHIIDINLGINSNLWYKASDKISMELKITPQLNATITNLAINKPTVQEKDRGGNIAGDESDFSYYLSFATKFKIQDFTKSRRRRSKR